MPRSDVMDLMKSLKFVGMPRAYDEVLAGGRKRRQTTETIIEELFQIEVGERQARSIRYRMTQARFPVPKDLDSFEFDKLPGDEAQVQALQVRVKIPVITTGSKVVSVQAGVPMRVKTSGLFGVYVIVVCVVGFPRLTIVSIAGFIRGPFKLN